MTVFSEQLRKVLPEGMEIPKELEMLYGYIEENRLYTDNDKDGETERIGFLYPQEEMQKSWTDSGRDGGTDAEFYPGDPENFRYWFGTDSDEIRSRLCVFGQSGAEGSEFALWKADDGSIKFVHMGSGSGSTMVCVLTDNGVDFLRLLAIGYDELCWDECFDYPPNEAPGCDFIVKPNMRFRRWVEETFGVDIPKTASEIVKDPSGENDEFCKWVDKMVE